MKEQSQPIEPKISCEKKCADSCSDEGKHSNNMIEVQKLIQGNRGHSRNMDYERSRTKNG